MMSEGEKRVYLALYMKKEGLHLRDICRHTKLTLPAVSKHVNRGEKEKLIVCKIKGRLKICRLDFTNPKLVPLLQTIENERFHKLPYSVRESINSFIDDLQERPLILLIFGSFAKNTYTKNSDLDVLLVYQRLDNRLMKSIEFSASKIKGRTGVNIQPVSLGYGDFEKNFLDVENEFMKDIKVYALVLQGLDAYLKLLGRLLK